MSFLGIRNLLCIKIVFGMYSRYLSFLFLLFLLKGLEWAFSESKVGQSDNGEVQFQGVQKQQNESTKEDPSDKKVVTL